MSNQNWRRMKVGRETDQAVAERLGWYDFSENQFGKLFGTDPAGHRGTVEFYSADMDAAVSLWETVPDDWTPRLVRMLQPSGDIMTAIYKAGYLQNETHEQIEEWANSPAFALVRGWLAWVDIRDFEAGKDHEIESAGG